MTPEEAKFILSAVRFENGSPCGNDSTVAEAFAVAEKDPALKQWLAESVDFDSAVADQLSDIDPPNDLKSNILTGVRVSLDRPWWKKPALLAAAAVLTIALPFTFFMQDKGPDAAHFRDHFVQQVQSLDRFDFVSNDVKEIQTWLTANGSPNGIEIPETLKGLPSAGCRVFEWEGSRATLICFRESKDAERATLHLVVLESNSIQDIEENHPRFAENRGWPTASWKSGSHTFLLTSSGGESALRRFSPAT